MKLLIHKKYDLPLPIIDVIISTILFYYNYKLEKFNNETIKLNELLY